MARKRSENSEQKGTTSKHIEVEIPTFIKIKIPPIPIPNHTVDGEFFLDSVLCWVALVVRSQRSQNKWTASPASPPVSPPVSPPASPPLSPPDPLTFMLGLLLLLPSHTNYRIKWVFKIQPKTRYLCQQKLPKTKQLVLDGVGRLHNILHPVDNFSGWSFCKLWPYRRRWKETVLEAMTSPNSVCQSKHVIDNFGN